MFCALPRFSLFMRVSKNETDRQERLENPGGGRKGDMKWKGKERIRKGRHQVSGREQGRVGGVGGRKGRWGEARV